MTNSSEIVTFCGGQQFTPYKNLSETFPPILPNNRCSSSNNISTRNATTSQPNTHANHEETANNISNSMPIASSPLSEVAPTEISSSLTILPEDTKEPVNRTDTRKCKILYTIIVRSSFLHFSNEVFSNYSITAPPSYAEAIKQPPAKKS